MKLLGSMLVALFIVCLPPAAISKVKIIESKYSGTDSVVWTSKNKQGQVTVHLYMYWGKDCPHCHEAMPFIKTMAKKYPWIKVHLREVSDNRRNLVSLYDMADSLGEPNVAIPAFFYCGYLYTGWGETSSTGPWLVDELKECRGNPI